MAWRREDGQATVEYVALIALVALVLAVGTVVLAGATGFGERIVHTIRQGLCAVAGFACPTPREPCVVNRATNSDTATVTIGYVRLGEDALVLREVRSDGRIVVTLIGGAHGGAEIGIGGGGRIGPGGAEIGGGTELRAAAIVRLGGGRSWIVRNDAEADRLIDALGAAETTPLVDLPVEVVDEIFGGAASEVRAPDIEFTEGGPGGDANASIGVGPLSAAGGLTLKQALGMRTDHTTGRRTVYFKLDGRSSQSLSATLLGGSLETSGPLSLEVTFDRHWQPYELAVAASRSAELVARLPVGLRNLVARTAGSGLAAPGTRLEVSARLDLTSPANADAAKRVLAALRHPGDPGEVGAAVKELGSRLIDGSRLAARIYATRSHSLSAAGGVQVGVGVRGAGRHREEGAKLVHAWERPPDGVWSERTDCLGAARRLTA